MVNYRRQGRANPLQVKLIIMFAHFTPGWRKETWSGFLIKIRTSRRQQDVWRVGGGGGGGADG